MDPAAFLTVVLFVAIVIAAVHQWLLDSPLFELGAASWFPAGGRLPTVRAVARSVLSGVIPLGATVLAAVLVLTAPFRVWVWGVVSLLVATVALSPILAVYHYDVRLPTSAEAAMLPPPSELDCEVLVVSDTRDGLVNGYAIGGPFRDVIGVSEFALACLSPTQVAALLAHESCHHRERHVLVRGGVSAIVLATWATMTTALFDALTPLIAFSLLVTVGTERIVSYRVMRWLEYRADAVAAQRTSSEAVVSLLAALDETADVDQTRVPRRLRVFSTHPSYTDRIARLQERDTGDEEREHLREYSW